MYDLFCEFLALVSTGGSLFSGFPHRDYIPEHVAAGLNPTARKLLKAVEKFHTYIENNENNKIFIPNYGVRYRHRERISPGLVASPVHHVMSKHFCGSVAST